MKPMACARCSVVLLWPDDFPNRTYAICRLCYPAWSGQRIEGSRPWMATLYGVGRWLRDLLTKGPAQK